MLKNSLHNLIHSGTSGKQETQKGVKGVKWGKKEAKHTWELVTCSAGLARARFSHENRLGPKSSSVFSRSMSGALSNGTRLGVVK